MIYGFDTMDEADAVGALLVYATWRSRNRARYQIRPDTWSQIERFVKASAKRATTLGQFLESFKPRLCCESLQPRAMQLGPLAAANDEPREFLTEVLGTCDQAAVLRVLYRETSWIVLLVRDRLERERPIEGQIESQIEEVSEEEEEEDDDRT